MKTREGRKTRGGGKKKWPTYTNKHIVTVDKEIRQLKSSLIIKIQIHSSILNYGIADII